jgi:hypothetical protein
MRCGNSRVKPACPIQPCTGPDWGGSEHHFERDRFSQAPNLPDWPEFASSLFPAFLMRGKPSHQRDPPKAAAILKWLADGSEN